MLLISGTEEDRKTESGRKNVMVVGEKGREGEGGGEEEGTCIRHAPLLTSYRAIY